MATFDKLIQEIGSRYCIGPKACPLVQETFGLIIGGFLDRFKAAGFAAEVASWLGGTEVVPLSGQEVEETLGSDVISEIANKAGVSKSFAGTIMGYAIPKNGCSRAPDRACGPRPDRATCRARDRQASGIGSLPHSRV